MLMSKDLFMGMLRAIITHACKTQNCIVSLSNPFLLIIFHHTDQSLTFQHPHVFVPKLSSNI